MGLLLCRIFFPIHPFPLFPFVSNVKKLSSLGRRLASSVFPHFDSSGSFSFDVSIFHASKLLFFFFPSPPPFPSLGHPPSQMEGSAVFAQTHPPSPSALQGNRPPFRLLGFFFSDGREDLDHGDPFFPLSPGGKDSDSKDRRPFFFSPPPTEVPEPPLLSRSPPFQGEGRCWPTFPFF